MHTNRMLPYVGAAAVVSAVLIAVGAPLASLLPFALLLVCPLTMVLMMRRMSGSHGANHTGPAPEQDPATTADPVRPVGSTR